MQKKPATSRVFTDISLDFEPHPVSKDIVTLINEEAIKRSVRNLIRTNFFERKFHSEIGSNIPGLLFDPATPLTANSIEFSVRAVLGNFEPRISILELHVTPRFDQHSFEITLIFQILNIDTPVTISIFLERTR